MVRVGVGVPSQESRELASWIGPAPVLIAVVFGLGALAVVVAGLTVPIPGTVVVTDPRELFATLGAALTGPVGGIIIGVLAGMREPVAVIPSLIAHVAGGVWMGFAYRKLVYERLAMPLRIGGWAALVLSYYYLVVVPGFVFGQALLMANDQIETGVVLYFLPTAYAILAQGVVPEALLTTAVTTLVFVAVPRKYHRPLWGVGKNAVGPAMGPATTIGRSQEVAVESECQAPSAGPYGRISHVRGSFAWRLAILLVLMSFLPIAVMLVFVRNTVADSLISLSSQETRMQANQLAAEVSLLPDEYSIQTVLTTTSDEHHIAFVVNRDGYSLVRPRNHRASVAALDILTPTTVREVLEGGGGVVHETESGRIVGYAEVPDRDWIAVVIMEGSVVSGAIQQMETASLVQLGASLLIVSIIAAAVIWLVMGPIRYLARATEDVGAGKLDVVVNASELEGELAILATAFNRMTRQLRESYDMLERRVAVRTRELATINSISALVSRSLDLEEILEAAVDKTMETGGFEVGAAYRLDDKNQTLTLLAHRGLSDDYVREAATLPLRAGGGWPGASVGQPLIRKVWDYPPGKFRAQLEAENVQTVVAIPLVAKDRVVGLVGLGAREPRDFAPQDLSLMAAIGQQVGMAVDNARLYEQAEESAVAAERSRLARDLHDAVTQTLFSASLIADVLPRLFERNPEEARRRLDELRQLTRGALAEMRTLLLELRPAALTEAPLGNLLRHLVEATAGRARIPVRLTVDEQGTLPPEAQVALYRIAQEVLNNIAKHSGASEATVTLRQQPDCVELVVADNGCGFDPSKVSSDHLGLGIIGERARAIGADLKVESGIGQGTRITVVWTNGE